LAALSQPQPMNDRLLKIFKSNFIIDIANVPVAADCERLVIAEYKYITDRLASA